MIVLRLLHSFVVQTFVFLGAHLLALRVGVDTTAAYVIGFSVCVLLALPINWLIVQSMEKK